MDVHRLEHAYLMSTLIWGFFDIVLLIIVSIIVSLILDAPKDIPTSNS